MAIHPDFQKILDLANILPPADFTRPPLDLAREMRSMPATIPPLHTAVAVEARTVSAQDGYPIPIRIYRPLSPEPHAVLVSFHGGGWVLGSLDSYEFRSHFMAHEVGCAVVTVDYRLAPEHPFPVPFDDCLSVVRWIAAQADALGFDATRIGVGGDSAGGNLAAAVALKLRDTGGLKLKCQILDYPICDHDFDRPSYLQNSEGKFLTREMMIWFWNQYAAGADRNLRYLSPLRCADLTRLPPALILTAEYDPLRDEGEAYAQALQQAGNLVVSHRLAGHIHGFQSVCPDHPLTIESLEYAVRFIARHLETERPCAG